MSVHMFRCFIGRGKMSITDLETRIDDWLSTNDRWVEDTTTHELRELNTEPDGTGETYYGVNVRFHQTDTKDNLLQKFTDKLKDKVDWYRVGYHDCTHDETSPLPCSWNDAVEWTAKDVIIPAAIPTFDVVATDGGVNRRDVLKAGVTVGAASTLLRTASEPVRAATQTIKTATHHDNAIAEKGVHHEQPSNTDWVAAEIVEKGYPTTDEGGSSLAAYYPLDEDSGSTANDVAGNNDGTISGATVGQTGILGTTCYSFDGTDDSIEVPDSSALSMNGSFSVACWMNLDNTGSEQIAVSKGWNSGEREYYIGTWDGSEWRFTIRYSDGSGQTLLEAGTVTSNEWVHLAGVYDDIAQEMRLYVDGVEIASTSHTEGISGGSDPLWVGQLGQGNSFLDGRLDDVRIYNRALSGTEVTRLYEAAL